MKIGLVGRVAKHELLFDGQTVKTRYLYEVLKEIGEVFVVDTFNYRNNIVLTFYNSLKALVNCDVIVLSVSINGRKFFFPFYYYLNRVFKKKIFHSLIGGRLDNNIEQNPSWKKFVKSFDGNWVESHDLVAKLKMMGIDNASYLPNFKKIPIVKLLDNYTYERPICFCMFSRVQKKKGIEDAILAIDAINKKYGNIIAKLDIYGPIDEDYKLEFENLMNKHQEFAVYKGIVESSKSVDVIKDYFILLFPTRYYNEGIPGTIIDALSAGVPVIARRWHYCDEMLTDGVNSLIYDFEDEKGLFEKIDYSIQHIYNIIEMKKQCIAKAEEYSFEYAKKILESLVRQ